MIGYRILRCDWLPERESWRYLARVGLPAVSCKEVLFFFPYNQSFIDQVSSEWLDIGLVLLFLRVYGPRRSQLT